MGADPAFGRIENSFYIATLGVEIDQQTQFVGRTFQIGCQLVQRLPCEKLEHLKLNQNDTFNDKIRLVPPQLLA